MRNAIELNDETMFSIELIYFLFRRNLQFIGFYNIRF